MHTTCSNKMFVFNIEKAFVKTHGHDYFHINIDKAFN